MDSVTHVTVDIWCVETNFVWISNTFYNTVHNVDSDGRRVLRIINNWTFSNIDFHFDCTLYSCFEQPNSVPCIKNKKAKITSLKYMLCCLCYHRRVHYNLGIHSETMGSYLRAPQNSGRILFEWFYTNSIFHNTYV